MATHLISTSQSELEVFNADDTYVIASGVNLADPGQVAFLSHVSATLYNFGGVFAADVGAIEFTAGNATIWNDTAALISGSSGIVMDDSGSDESLHLTNYGRIIATANYGIETHGTLTSIDVTNYGLIQGPWAGIYGQASQGYVYNYGTISGNAGVQFDSLAHHVTVDNHATISGSSGGGVQVAGTAGSSVSVYNEGTIKGWAAIEGSADSFYVENHGTLTALHYGAISITSGTLTLYNYSTIEGTVYLSADAMNDKIYNYGTISALDLGGGDDVYNGAKGKISGTFYNDGTDTASNIRAGDGKDTIIGGSGAERISGGAGNDKLTGGGGADRFYFDSALTHNLDQITDFTHAKDAIVLSQSIFTKVTADSHGHLKASMFHPGATAHDADDRIMYDSTTGWLTYDANGTAANGIHHFATLATGLTLSASDFIIQG